MSPGPLGVLHSRVFCKLCLLSQTQGLQKLSCRRRMAVCLRTEGRQVNNTPLATSHAATPPALPPASAPLPSVEQVITWAQLDDADAEVIRKHKLDMRETTHESQGERKGGLERRLRVKMTQSGEV